jgi:putative FmdB family regulatory protein
MPLYEYTCRQCDHAFETLVFDGDTVECPLCQSKRLERQMSLPALGKVQSDALPMSGCGDLSLPPCGAPGCRRTGKP